VAALMELANALEEHLQGGGSRAAAWDFAVRTLVLLLNPMAPHLGEELWERTGGVGLAADAAWPEYEAALATDPTVTLVVQVNGVRREALEVPRGLSEAQALERALQSERVAHFLNGDKPSRVFYVPDKLINLVP
ncbi:MAG: leucine--tRNA ligase, partial [Chloroflexi bacterium]